MTNQKVEVHFLLYTNLVGYSKKRQCKILATNLKTNSRYNYQFKYSKQKNYLKIKVVGIQIIKLRNKYLN